MKSITCNQLDGACDKVFEANTFEQIAELSKQHGTEMLINGDELHLQAIGKMQEFMKNTGAMEKLFE